MPKRRSRKHSKNRRHTNHPKKEEKVDPKFLMKKFFFWYVVYFISISLLSVLFQNTQIYQNRIGFYILAGYLLVLISRVVYSSMKSREIRFSGIVVWGLIYTVVFGLLDFFLDKILNINVNPKLDLFIYVAIFSIFFTISLIFLRRMKINTRKKIRAPSQIFTGVLLLIAGILSWRFSTIVFIDWFNWPEGLAWSWLIGLGLIIGGALVLLAWWKNNVSMFTTRHTVNWNK